MLFFISVIDWGMLQNRKFGKEFYMMGEIVQLHFLMLGEHVWIERDNACGMVRIAFGEDPKFPELTSPELAMLEVTKHFQKLLIGGSDE